MINQIIHNAIHEKTTSSQESFDLILEYKDISFSLEEYIKEEVLKNAKDFSINVFKNLNIDKSNIFYQISEESLCLSEEGILDSIQEKLKHFRQYFHLYREEYNYLLSRYRKKIHDSPATHYRNKICAFNKHEFSNFHELIKDFTNEIKTSPSRIKITKDADGDPIFHIGVYWKKLFKSINEWTYLIDVTPNMKPSGFGYLQSPDGPDVLQGWAMKLDIAKLRINIFASSTVINKYPYYLTKKEVLEVLDYADKVMNDTEKLITDLDNYSKIVISKINALDLPDNIKRMGINNQEKLPLFISEFIKRYIEALGSVVLKMSFHEIKEDK